MMAETKHLTYFKVENFKCFESFEMDDIGQFNLIVGDNNVGKTSALEAMLFDEDIHRYLGNYLSTFVAKYPEYAHKIQNTRTYNFMQLFVNTQGGSNEITYTFSMKGGNGSTQLSYKIGHVSQLFPEELSMYNEKVFTNKEIRYLLFLRSGKKLHSVASINSTEIGQQYTERYLPYISVNRGYAPDLVGFYSERVQPSKEQKELLIETVRFFIPEIEDIEVSPSAVEGEVILGIRERGMDGIMPLFMYGDGTFKLMRILLEIAETKDGFLLIDEIDSGIHYSRFKQFWKTVLKAARTNNVQLFATTHNLECLNFFKEAPVELEAEEPVKYKEEARHFLMDRISDGSIKAYNHNFDQFSSALELGNEIRGGD